MTNNKNKQQLIPILPTLGVVAFPKSLVSIDISRKMNIQAINYAIKNRKNILVVCQNDLKIEYPKMQDLYPVGTVVSIKQFQKRANGIYTLTGLGLYKASIVDYVEYPQYLAASIKRIIDKRTSIGTKYEIEVLVRMLKKLFLKYTFLVKMNNQEITFLIENEQNPLSLFYIISTLVPFHYDIKQNLLCERDIYIKLKMLYEELDKETKFIELENEVSLEIEEKIDRNQKEYYLREKVKLLNQKLNNEKDSTQEDEYTKKVKAIKSIDKQSREKLLNEIKKMNSMPDMSHESYVISNYLDTVLSLPWDKQTKDKIDIKNAQKQLDEDHYGLEKVKERIIENLAVRVFKKDLKSQILCLVGPPGVGKTSLGKSIAKTMGRKFIRISLGGVNDESEIRGHRKTYIGAMPGRIMTAISQAKSKNPVILLDEIDKMTSNFKGDPSSAMLEVLDKEQNSLFVDHYIEIPFDLSNCLFITTANDISTIPSPLRDRMEIIELSSYTINEKYNIAKGYLIDKQLKANGMTKKQIKISDDAIKEIIDGYTREAGVRSLERQIASLIRKGAKKIAITDIKSVSFNKNNIKDYLGRRKYLDNMLNKKDEIGLVNGLAWTSVGGELMQIEVGVLEGKGDIKLTGNLGDVMKESAHAAFSYVRSVADKYNIPHDFYKNTDIHIHLPEGAVPKDGPSAGVTVVVGLISALTKMPVKKDVAMTGEITLKGRVLPIGGLKEKSIAAYKAGIKTVYIPKENMVDLEEIDNEVKEVINFMPVEYVDEIVDNVLIKQTSKINSKSKMVDYKKIPKVPVSKATIYN